MVRGPLEAAHLLPVALQPPLGLQRWRTDVPLQDDTVTAAGRELLGVPGQRPHTRRVALQHRQLLAGRRVPDLHEALVCAHGHQVPPLGPAHRGHRVAFHREVTQPGHLAGARAPQVDAGAQAHAEHVERGPVDQVQVEVVLQLGRVQHLERDLRDLPGWLPRRAQQLLALVADGGQGVGGDVVAIVGARTLGAEGICEQPLPLGCRGLQPAVLGLGVLHLLDAVT